LALKEAIGKLEIEDVELVVFGSGKPKDTENLKYPIHYMGHLYDDVTLRLLYSAADVVVVPSREEAFGQMATESMACGTPVVAFGHTGLLDIVDHKTNGYLAKPSDIDDLARGKEWVLSSDSYNTLSRAAREKVLAYFDSRLLANRYIELYNTEIKKSGKIEGQVI
jgi:glycosyltransferase involved in cell wall biosynthesis